MKRELHADLIDGQFTPEDARELLIDLFSRKTNFHEIQNFSANERFGKDDPFHINRIDALTKSMDQLNNLFREVDGSGKKLVIRSVVSIAVSD
ncbi:hypothetical protein [Lacibacter sp. H407]|uniref:hypothetical protein n=1 Tax=Lacibacter sp. H407 TaxID=3133423 RepID=UPI0030C36EFC